MHGHPVVTRHVLELPCNHGTSGTQAERDSLAGLSEVHASQAPDLIPNIGGWYGEPNQATDQPPQQPGLVHLRRRLGLPVQQPVHENGQGGAAQQEEASPQGHQQDAQQHFASCTYEVC